MQMWRENIICHGKHTVQYFKGHRERVVLKKQIVQKKRKPSQIIYYLNNINLYGLHWENGFQTRTFLFKFLYLTLHIVNRFTW